MLGRNTVGSLCRTGGVCRRLGGNRRLGAAQGQRTAALIRCTPGLRLLLAEHEQLGVLGGRLLGGSNLLLALGDHPPLALQDNRGDQALDLRRLGGGLLALLGRQGTTDHIATHIVLLGQIVELADLAGPLGAQTPGLADVREAGDVLLALANHHQGQHGHIGIDDATTHGFALPLAIATGTVAGLSGLEEQADTLLAENALHHGESLLVISAGDAEHVALPLVAQLIRRNRGPHTLLVENPQLVLVHHLVELLAASDWIGRFKNNLEMEAFRGDKERAAAMLISRTEITPKCIEIGYMYKEI